MNFTIPYNFKALLAGIMIGLGCIANCTTFTLSPILGSLLFSIGLMCVILQQHNLYTGKIGYVSKENWKDLIPMLIYNMGGTVLICVPFLFTRTAGIICDNASIFTEVKLNDSLLSLFILGIGCGMMVFLAVDNYKREANPLLVFIPIMFFILCGFEHCIADAGYFVLARDVDFWEVLIRIVIIAIGNSIGSLILSKLNVTVILCRYGKK